MEEQNTPGSEWHHHHRLLGRGVGDYQAAQEGEGVGGQDGREAGVSQVGGARHLGAGGEVTKLLALGTLHCVKNH